MTVFNTIAKKIIKEQELVIGPLAWSEARKVPGLSIGNVNDGDINIAEGQEKEIIDKLVKQYERLFGVSSVEVCHAAVASIIAELPPDEVPASLK